MDAFSVFPNATPNSELPALLHQYARLGKRKGASLLLTPAQALDFLQELQRIQVAVDGIELWRQLHPAHADYIVEEPIGPWFDDLMGRDDVALATTTAAIAYLTNDLPPAIDFVSFVLDDPYYLVFETEADPFHSQSSG